MSQKQKAAWRLVWWGVQRDGWRALVPISITMRYLEEGCVIPFGYGIAWRDYRTDCWVCLPIGVNVIAAAVRRTYHWLMIQPTRDPSVIDVAVERGRTLERARQRRENAKWDPLVEELRLRMTTKTTIETNGAA